MAIGLGLGSLVLPSTIGLLPAILGGAGIATILNGMGFKVPAPVVPKTTAAGMCPFEEAHNEVNALDVTEAEKNAAHEFLNKAENLKVAHDAMTKAIFSNNV